MHRPLAALAALITLFAVDTAFAQVETDAVVDNAYDGDTLSVRADIWPNMMWQGSVRVRGVDTPEIRGSCEQESTRALLARDYVRTLLVEKTVRLTEIENDLYGGRVLARVYFVDEDTQETVSLAERLIALGHGRAYEGGTRQGWCEADVPDLVDEPVFAGNPLDLYDDNGNGTISCSEARAHGIAPVTVEHPAYYFIIDRDGDGVVCE